MLQLAINRLKKHAFIERMYGYLILNVSEIVVGLFSKQEKLVCWMANESCHFFNSSKFCNFRINKYFKYDILIAMNFFHSNA